MSTWKFDIDKSGKTSNTVENFETETLKEKIIKLRSKKAKIENPKSIPLLDNLFDPIERLYSEMTTERKEGFELKNKVTDELADVGGKILAGIEGAEDSLKTAFTKIGDLNAKSAFEKVNFDKLMDSMKDVKLNPNVDGLSTDKMSGALKSSTNFIIPDPSVSNIPNFKMETSGVSDNTIFKDGKDAISSIINETSNSKLLNKLSANSMDIHGKLNALKGELNNNSLTNPNNKISADDMKDSSPGIDASSIKVVGLGDQMKKKFKEALSQIKGILNYLVKVLVKGLKYGALQFEWFFVHFRDNFNYALITIANSLTHNHTSVEEIRVFSSETLKFLTILFTSVFLYNWYFLMFHNDDPTFRYSINVEENVFNYSKVLYAIVGPSLRAVEFIDWILLEQIPMIKQFVSSKPVLFFILAVIFFILVLGNFQKMILTSFLQSLSFSLNQNVLSIIVSVITLAYGLKFICYDAGLIGAIFSSGSAIITGVGMLFYLLLFVLYIIFIASFSSPLAILLINTYIVVYSFFALLIYEKSKMFTTVNDIYKAVSGLDSLGDDGGQTGGGQQTGGEGEGGSSEGYMAKALEFFAKIGVYIEKWIKYINMFLMELLVILILIFGIDTYTSQFGSITFDKTSTKTVNSIAAPINSAFTHLFTWLIVFNSLLIVVVIVRIVAKYNRLVLHTEEGEDDSEDTGDG